MRKGSKQRGQLRSKTREKKLSRIHKPEDMSLEEWQVRLRQQFGREQNFLMENIGDHPIFSEYSVTNPETGMTYRVAIRGQRIGMNYCSCPAFSVNTLGTCKQIEFALAELGKTTRNNRLLKAGYVPPFSEVYLRYGAHRKVVFSAGQDAPEELKKTKCYNSSLNE